MRKVLFLAIIVVLSVSSCSLNKLVINKVSDALTGGGANTVFMGDNDPRLVGDAMPFAIKMYESLLDQNPNHQGLIVTTGSLFIMYANAFVQGPAEMLPLSQYEEKWAELERAKNLYLRGVTILERGINNKYPGMLGKWGPEENPQFTGGLSKMKQEDITLFYWYAAGTLSAYALNVFDISLGMRVPQIVEMINKAYELDSGYNSGALDELFFIVYSALPDGMGGDMEKALVHYQKALEKSGGQTAGPYVSYAQSVAVKKQDYDDFKNSLEKALDIDPNADRNNTLINVINQKKARYLLEKARDLFVTLEIEDDFYYDEEYY
ncbi:MAG: TRAP transporter TatT component family protein [Treponema sp.]|nr:TRAP transporter TatT component family protein [Treponema sp.]